MKGWLILWFGAAVLSIFISDGTHDLARSLAAPSLPHFGGFDSFGRDLMLLTLRASLLSAWIALAATAASCALGVLIGGGMALAPRGIRRAFVAALEFTLAFPSLLVALAWAAVRGPGWDTLALALALGIIPSFIRLAHARTRELLHEEYVLAARSLGSSPLRLLRTHITPELLQLCRVKFPQLFAHALLAEASLSFLGIGAPIGRDTWGGLLAQGKDYLFEAPHIAITTGLPLALTVLALQWLSGDTGLKAR